MQHAEPFFMLRYAFKLATIYIYAATLHFSFMETGDNDVIAICICYVYLSNTNMSSGFNT